jgi:hypothetical protein
MPTLSPAISAKNSMFMRSFNYAALIALACFSSLASAGDISCSNIEQCQRIPPGFTWQESKIDVGAFLRPDGWFLKEEVKGDTRALFITREDIERSGSFATGFSVNKVPNFFQKTKTSPSAYARAIAARLRTSGKVLRESVVAGEFPEMNIVRVKFIKDGISVIVHYITIGDDKKDVFYLISFEAPERDWEEQIKIGTPMLNFFAL